MNLRFKNVDFMAIVTLIVTFLFGFWGLQLSIASLQLSEKVANQDLTIKHFDSLLNYTRSEIDTLSKLNKLLFFQNQIFEKELSISTKRQLQIDKQINVNNTSDANRLYTSALSLLYFVVDKRNHKIDSATRLNNFYYISSIIDKELSNSYLIANKKLYSRWVRVKEVIKIEFDFYLTNTNENEKLLSHKKVLQDLVVFAGDVIGYSLEFINKKS